MTSLVYLEKLKGKLQILVLGAYKPERALRRLEQLRDCLIRRKFASAKLVCDFKDEAPYDDDLDVHFTKKSRTLIEHWADVPIFVFFREGNNLGVGNELGYTCSTLPNKTCRSAVFLEAKLDVGSQVRGTIKLGAREQKLSYEDFNKDNLLCNLAFGHCRKVLDELFHILGDKTRCQVRTKGA